MAEAKIDEEKKQKEVEVDYDTISDKELVELIKNKSSEVLVIDVRDPDPEEGDYLGGNIINSVNIPSYDFVDKLPEIINTKNLSDNGIKTVVIVGMMSKSRGPQCYRLYNKAKHLLITNDNKLDNNEFNNIVSKIELDGKSIENLKNQKLSVIYFLIISF